MSEAQHIALLTGMIDGVDVASAAARVADMRAQDQGKDLGAALTGSGNTARASVHEAAHAVVAHLVGFKVESARVRADGTGAVHYEARHDDLCDMFAVVEVDLAGIAIELLAGADQRRQFALAHGFDVLTARLNIERCRALVPSWELSHKTFAQMACCLVMANRPAIERVAACLRAVGELNGAEVAALSGRAQ